MHADTDYLYPLAEGLEECYNSAVWEEGMIVYIQLPRGYLQMLGNGVTHLPSSTTGLLLPGWPPFAPCPVTPCFPHLSLPGIVLPPAHRALARAAASIWNVLHKPCHIPSPSQRLLFL